MDYSKIYLGLFNSEKIMLGSTRIEKAYLGTTLILNYEHNYSNDYLTFKITSTGTINVPTGTTYSINGGEWENTGTTLTVNGGESIRFKGNNTTYSGNAFSGSTAVFELEGNIMSMIYGDDFIGKTSFPSGSVYNFVRFFQNCTGLTSAENLILPATTLSVYCYSNMFQDCANLIKSPTILPATTLQKNCYQDMFRNCPNLTTSPYLPATALVTNCYSNLFNGCSSLNYIKCMAASNRGNGYTTSWVKKVASTGTFVKNPSASAWGTSVNFCPPGWTQINAS